MARGSVRSGAVGCLTARPIALALRRGRAARVDGAAGCLPAGPAWLWRGTAPRGGALRAFLARPHDLGGRGPGAAMKPEDVLRVIADLRGDAICVPTMTTAPAWRLIAPDDLSVVCVGFMGGASSLGLGLALARPDRRVLVFDGDGSLLMQLGSLATVAAARPRNLVHLVFKNGVYQTSGAQEIPGGLGIDFVAMAKAAGYPAAVAIDDLAEFRRRLPGLLAGEGPVLVELSTGLAEQTPMTAPGGKPFHQQVEELRRELRGR